MKKTAYLWLLLAMCLCFPLLLLMGKCLGFEVIVRNWGMHGAVFTAVFVFVSFKAMQKAKASRTDSILAALLLPASAIHAFFWTIGKGRFWLAAVLSLVWVSFSAALMMKYTRSFGAKVTGYYLTLLVLAPTVLMILALLFSVGNLAVMQTAVSPERNYQAEVIDSDQGALGGATIVEVYNLEKQWDTIIFLIRSKPQEVYRGNWGEFENMKLQWKSEKVLQINGKDYLIQ